MILFIGMLILTFKGPLIKAFDTILLVLRHNRGGISEWGKSGDDRRSGLRNTEDREIMIPSGGRRHITTKGNNIEYDVVSVGVSWAVVGTIG